MTARLLPEMTPDQRRCGGREILTFRHRLDDTGLFSDVSLARLIDETPSDSILIQTPSRRSAEPWVLGAAGLANGTDLLAAARRGLLWIEVPAIQNIRYARVFDRLMDEFATSMGLELLEADAKVVIASPNMRPRFHVAATENMILHVRGQELIQVHAPHGPQLEEQRLEAILRREEPADLPSDVALRRGATPISLPAGHAAWWPLHSPHRALTGEGLSISLSVTFSSPRTRRANNLICANGFFGRTLGRRLISQRMPAILQSICLIAARLFLPLQHISPPPSPMTPRFLVDVGVPSCIRWRRSHPEAVRRAA